MKQEGEQKNMQREHEKITRFGFLWGGRRKFCLFLFIFFFQKKLMKDKVSPRKHVKYLNT